MKNDTINSGIKLIVNKMFDIANCDIKQETVIFDITICDIKDEKDIINSGIKLIIN